MTYGTTLRIPGEFFDVSTALKHETDFINSFRKQMSRLKPQQTTNHDTAGKFFVQKELSRCTHVFVRNDTVRASLQPPYDGPYEIVTRFNKNFAVKINNREVNISIDRLKAAFTTERENNDISSNQPASLNTPNDSATPRKKLTFKEDSPVYSKFGRRIQKPVRYT